MSHTFTSWRANCGSFLVKLTLQRHLGLSYLALKSPLLKCRKKKSSRLLRINLARHNLFVEALFQKLPNFWSVLYNRLCLVPRIVQRFIMNLASVVIIKSRPVLKSLSTIKIKIYIAICQVYVPYIYKITLPTSNCHKSFHHYCQPQLILTHSTSLSKHWV